MHLLTRALIWLFGYSAYRFVWGGQQFRVHIPRFLARRRHELELTKLALQLLKDPPHLILGRDIYCSPVPLDGTPVWPRLAK
jgi:hypothetical protein